MVKIKVFTHLDCDKCLQAVDMVDKMKRNFGNLDVEQVDVFKYPEEVARYRIFMAPSIVVENHVFHGTPSKRELIDRIKVLKIKEATGSNNVR